VNIRRVRDGPGLAGTNRVRVLVLVLLTACGARLDTGAGTSPDAAAPQPGLDAQGDGSSSSCVLGTLANCGFCGDACPAGDFCDGTQCNMPTFPSFCANNDVTIIYDGITEDNAAADVMASTITANCPASVMVHSGKQTDPALVDQATGQPLGGSGVTYVLGGGPFPNVVLKWLERTHDITKVYFDAPDGIHFYWRLRATGVAVATMAGANCSTHVDQFVTELVTDPMSGTLSLVGYGACTGNGTLAAAWYYANVILPNKAMYPDSWYVFGWSDTNGNATPDSGDSFTVLAHGL
jgi:hypothetical protein